MKILKVGGSLLAKKGEAPRFESEAFGRLLREVAGSGSVPGVLIHGAGAYGHNPASEARDTTDLAPAEVSRIRASVAQLRARVSEALQAAGLEHCPLSPQEMFQMGGAPHPLAPVAQDLVSRGAPMMTWGDVAFEGGRYRIYSGDEAAFDIAASVPGRHEFVFATDVDGILDPSDGKVIPEFTEASMHVFGATGGAHRPDVTGGMAGKARKALAIARLGHRVVIVNGGRPGAVGAALSGGGVGTLVRAGGAR